MLLSVIVIVMAIENFSLTDALVIDNDILAIAFEQGFDNHGTNFVDCANRQLQTRRK